jgi:glucose-1-phosphate adenylyltransferase
MERTVAVVLGGGRGTRLYPLTQHRSKPAVPIGGKYRLIDIPVSNCINSGIKWILVLTQYNSESLNRHVAQTYVFDRFSEGFVSILAAEQTADSHRWFQGTADAVRQNLRHIMDLSPDLVLVLSGDQLYRMDFLEFAAGFRSSGSDIAIATKPVSRREAGRLGVMKVDAGGRIVRFSEKPGEDELDSLTSEQEGLPPGRPYLGSMGIYLFSPAVLTEILDSDPDATDFGREIIPAALDGYNVTSYLFDGYWADIGTIRHFFEANLDMASADPKFDLYRNFSKLYTRARALPGARIDGCSLEHSIVCDACDLKGASISRSVIGIRGRIREGSRVEDTVMMGADYWVGHFLDHGRHDPGLPEMGIGRGCVVRRAIIDKNARIGDGVRLLNEAGVEEADGDGYFIRQGIIVVPKNGVIFPDRVV